MKKAITTDMETHISAVTNLLSIYLPFFYTLKARCKALWIVQCCKQNNVPFI